MDKLIRVNDAVISGENDDPQAGIVRIEGWDKTDPEELQRFEDGPLYGGFVPAELRVDLKTIGYVAIPRELLETIKRDLERSISACKNAIVFIDDAIDRSDG